MPLYITYSLPKKKLEFRSEPNFSTVEKKKQDSSKLPKLNLGMSSIILAEFRMTLVLMTMIILADIILACNHHDCHHLMIILYLPSPPPG